MSFEILLLGLTLGVGAAVVKTASNHRIATHFETQKRFRKTFDRIIPPDGSRCSVCGDVATVENTRIIALDHVHDRATFVCDKTTCLLGYAQGDYEQHADAPPSTS